MFQNVSYASEHIHSIQSVPRSQERNVRKQAEQIRYCLIQAREYFSAARSVTSATKPLLQYYGLMSLALAEILIKQSGDSSIDRARSKHSHHGLSFTPIRNPASAPGLREAAAALVAKPHIVQSRRSGTFELWHRSSRETPVCGKVISHLTSGATQENYRIIAGSADIRMLPLPESGVTFLQCLQCLPQMKDVLQQLGIMPKICRGRVVGQYFEKTGYHRTQIIFHPYHAMILEEAYEKFMFSPSSFEQIEVLELERGCIVGWADKPPASVGCHMPNSFQQNADDVEFCIENECLNEFGVLYLSLYMLGNYARYYPEQWMADVERSTPLSVAAHELMVSADIRVPILALAELSRVWLLTKP